MLKSIFETDNFAKGIETPQPNALRSVFDTSVFEAPNQGSTDFDAIRKYEESLRADEAQERAKTGQHFVFGRYKSFCRLAATDNRIFKNFKMYPEYFNVVGCHNEKLNQKYAKHLDKNNSFLLAPDYLSVACKKDKIGNPPVGFDILPVDNKKSEKPVFVEGTSFQYICALSNLLDTFDKLDGINNIVEVGGGHGGQARKILAYKECDYHICGFHEENMLIEKVCDDLPLTIFTADNITERDYDLFFSDYSFTESPREIQLLYIEKLIKRSKFGYITSNASGQKGHMSLAEIVERIREKHQDIKVIDETPSTAPCCKRIVWGI